MKVTNWRRKLMASLVAGGMVAPAAAYSAELNTNLVINPGFENVDPTDMGPFDSDRILNWQDSNADGNPADDTFAYLFTQNFAGVNTPAGAGEHYFSGGYGTTAGQATITQSVNLASDPTGMLIPTGEAAFQLSGFFSSYLTQIDASSLRVRFLNESGSELGRSSAGGLAFVQTLLTAPSMLVIDPPPPVPPEQRNWGQDSRAGLIPAGTKSVAIEIVSDIATGNHDGYVDLVDFRVRNATELLLFLEVNTATGQTTVKNQTGGNTSIDYYEIISPGNALNATAWNSLQEQNLPGFPAGNGSGNGWEQFGGSDSGVIGESFLTGNSSLANNSEISLGTAFNPAGTRDLVFRYGQLTSSVQVPGDYNTNGAVDAADYVLWRENLNQNVTLPNDSTPGMVTQADYDVWRANFGRGGGPAGPSRLTTGFIRYVAGGAGIGSSLAVPEPVTVILVGIGLGAVVLGARCRLPED